MSSTIRRRVYRFPISLNYLMFGLFLLPLTASPLAFAGKLAGAMAHPSPSAANPGFHRSLWEKPDAPSAKLGLVGIAEKNLSTKDLKSINSYMAAARFVIVQVDEAFMTPPLPSHAKTLERVLGKMAVASKMAVGFCGLAGGLAATQGACTGSFESPELIQSAKYGTIAGIPWALKLMYSRYLRAHYIDYSEIATLLNSAVEALTTDDQYDTLFVTSIDGFRELEKQIVDLGFVPGTIGAEEEPTLAPLEDVIQTSRSGSQNTDLESGDANSTPPAIEDRKVASSSSLSSLGIGTPRLRTRSYSEDRWPEGDGDLTPRSSDNHSPGFRPALPNVAEDEEGTEVEADMHAQSPNQTPEVQGISGKIPTEAESEKQIALQKEWDKRRANVINGTVGKLKHHRRKGGT